MKIGIIGAGNIGGTLTRRFTALGHKVFVANSRGPETLADLAAETGATPVTARPSGPGWGRGYCDDPSKERSVFAGRFVRENAEEHGRRGHRKLLPEAARRSH